MPTRSSRSLHADLAVRRRGTQSGRLQLLARLEAFCAQAPHNRQLASLRAEALAVAGRFSEGRALCERELKAAERAGGDEASLWLYTLGRLLYDQSELEEASEKLKEALGRPGAPPACKPLLRHAQRLETERTAGNNAFKRGDWAGAVDAYTRALQVDAGHARFNALLYYNRAAAHAKKGLLSQAIADCSASIALDGAYAKAYLRRGELRQQCGDAPRAQEDYSSAQRLDRGAVGLEAARRLHELRSGAGSSRGHAGGGAHAGGGGGAAAAAAAA